MVDGHPTKGGSVAFTYDALDRLTDASGLYSAHYEYDPIGNMTSKVEEATTTLLYTDTAHVHAVSRVNGVRQRYDANGNMTERTIDGATYTQTWDYENRLVKVISGTQVTEFVYDGDGALVKRVEGDQVTVYVGQHYEKDVTADEEQTYYYFNGQRVAMRRDGVLYYLAGDHLGTTSLVLNANGTVHSEARHYPYGEERWSSGTLPTEYRFTGQRNHGYIKLTVMGARWYDAYLNQFLSPDSIIPQPANPASLNRYAYCLGNPLRFIDPSGHDPLDAAWQEEFRKVHGRDPTWEDILIRLFSIAFPEEWSNNIWNALYTSDGQIRAGAIQALFQRPPEGRDWAGMPEAIGQMAGWYREEETAEFIRDIGTLFGGLGDRFESNSLQAITGGRPHGVSVWIRREGLPEELLGSDATGNVHHWAWTLNLGYFTGRAAGRQINSTRERSGSNQCDANCRADLALGTIGADMGSFMSRGLLPSRSPNEFQNAWQLMPALQVSAQ